MSTKQKLNRKLIPYNLVLIIVSVVAILSLLFMPILTINLGQMMMGALDAVPTEGDELDSAKASVTIMLKALDKEIKFTTMSFARIAFSDKPEAEVLNEYVLGENNFVESALLSMVATSLLEESMPNVSQLNELDLSAANAELYELEKEGADPVEVAQNYVNKLNVELEKVGAAKISGVEEAEDLITNMYDTVCDKMNGSFSVEGFICLGLWGGGANAPTTYEELATRIADGETGNSDGTAYEEVDADFGSMLGIFEPLTMIGRYMKYFFYVMVAFMAPWGFLILFALLHLLLPNKRVSVWYIDLFGALPCLIFWVAPRALGAILSAKLSGSFGAIFAAIGSYAWVSGICFLVVLLLSIIWAGPIKRKIRRLKKVKVEE